ncbi:MAG TPA: GNAT family N-acetyltransferase [Euzebyales bacterium]|nr:GNAT family N-acetyltransferase [Euzebyales bacterium]
MPDPRVLRVRRARSFDLNEVADLWTDCGLVPSPRGFRNEMERMLLRAPELFLVAMDTDSGGKIVGALLGSFDGRVATVSRLATHPDHRRQGVASALVDDFTRALTDMGAEDALLLVLDGNPEADRFWAAIDYTHACDVPAYQRQSSTR